MNEKAKYLFELCMRGNQDTDYTFFFDYAGHTYGIDVAIFDEEWKDGSKAFYRDHCYLDKDYGTPIDDIITAVKALVGEL